MGLIQGVRVELITPYPREDLARVYQWLHACKDLTEDDDSPATPEEYESAMGLELVQCISYGIRRSGCADRWIGLFYFEPAGRRNGYLHIAMDPAAWGRGLADEAAALAIADLFARCGDLTRLSAAILEQNRAAQALARRMGFQLEAQFPDMIVQHGTPRSLMHFGLTRRQWRPRQQHAGLETVIATGGTDGTSN